MVAVLLCLANHASRVLQVMVRSVLVHIIVMNFIIILIFHTKEILEDYGENIITLNSAQPQ